MSVTLQQDLTQPLSMRPILLMSSGASSAQDPCYSSEEHAGPWVPSFQEGHTLSSQQQCIAIREAIPLQAGSGAPPLWLQALVFSRLKNFMLHITVSITGSP
ncbi:TPA: hypothetical protein ACH3X2_005282 [Trebouxia sp. C0005]